MVAATNNATNTMLKNALSPGATSSTSNKVAAPKDDASAPADEFMQLLNTFLDAPAAAGESSNATAAPNASTEKPKKDAETDADTAALPQWLLSPLLMTSIDSGGTPAAGNTDNAAAPDGIDALTSANTTAGNALLAQNLKRQGGDQSEQIATGDSKSTDSATSTAFAKQSDGQSPLDMLLGAAGKQAQSDALTKTHDLNKELSQPKDDAAKSPDAMQSFANVQLAVDAAKDAGAERYQIHSRVGSHEWAGEVSNRLSMMVSNKVQSASLQLTPDNLGPVQVKIEVNNNQASVWFSADHPDTRTALEQSLPRLRELFAAQGMSLMDAGVFSQQSQQQQAPLFSRESSASFGMTDMSHEATMTQQSLKIGLLDTYA